jgi:hypothetical protein
MCKRAVIKAFPVGTLTHRSHFNEQLRPTVHDSFASPPTLNERSIVIQSTLEQFIVPLPVAFQPSFKHQW